MTELGRRVFLGGAAGAAGMLLLVGCVPTAHPTAPPSSLTPVGPPDWPDLAKHVAGTLLMPSDAAFASAKLTENPRFDAAEPLAILQVANATDVTAALAFATKYRLPVALRAGGHNYAGWSAGGAAGSGVAASFVISTAALDTVALSADGSTVTVGAGASLAQVYDTVGRAGRAIAGGSCATVGVTGLTLGGGVGVLVRSFGLACDQLTELQVVTADGAVHTANTDDDPQLFWASRGGGGGILGVVTSLTFATQAAPTVTEWTYHFPLAAAPALIANWQNWVHASDQRNWSTLKLLGGLAKHPSGPSLSVSGTWTGPASQLGAQLAPLLAGLPAPTSHGSVTRSYHDAMMDYAGCHGLAIAECTTGPGGKLVRESSSGTSSIGYTALDSAGIADLLAQVQAAQSVEGIREGGISMDALGGAVANLAPDATAFPHRAALYTVQYTGTFDDGRDPAPIDAYVRGFRAAMTPHWGDHAYVNYADGSLSDPETAYYGDNLPRLRAIKKKYDPTGFFTQPQSY
ncbi:MAG: FAD-binding protein [Pseudolysinimonas sp.]